MRIIGGDLRGQKLVNFQADHIRPTTDRVKETIFNVLMGQFESARVLDLYAGTGNLSAEAISRGANSVDSVENNPKSQRIMLQNFQKLKLTDRISIHRQDVFQFLRRYSGEPFDVILIDPPFTEKLADSTMDTLVKNPHLFQDHTHIVIERSDHELMNESYGPLFCYKQKPFGDKTVHFFAKK